MTKTLTAYLVDVEKRTIRAVTFDAGNSLDEIRRHIGCRMIDMVRIDRSHSIVVDDNGLTDELTCFTVLKDYPSPLAGNLLIVGNDAAGETVSPRRPIEDIAGMLTIRFPVLSPTFEVLDGPVVFGSRVTGFEVTLKGVAPVVLPTGSAH
ncbi:MAG: DUF3846 domain-containing protein [Hyphomicrobiales bacterium]|jgi:hypothetical protein|nr:MAG: DUF3846 domain-containing protein [Hyphomicrobiales bacterium]